MTLQFNNENDEKKTFRTEHFLYADTEAPTPSGIQPLPKNRNCAGLQLIGQAACSAVWIELGVRCETALAFDQNKTYLQFI